MPKKSSARPDPSELVPVGIVGKPHGLKGEMRVHLHDSTSNSLSSSRKIVVLQPTGESSEEREVLAIRQQGRDLVVRVSGAETRNDAEALRGCEVLLPRGALPPTEEDEYYDVDLIGMRVLGAEGDELGVVEAVEHPPANDVLVITRRDGGYQDVPMIESVIISVDTEAASITLDIPDGLPRRARR